MENTYHCLCCCCWWWWLWRR